MAAHTSGTDESISRDFCCFMCNGRQVVQGYVTLHVSFVSLCLFNGKLLEDFEYSTVCSVNEEEPATPHSLIINLPHHSVYLCHLLRKELLLRVFQRLGMYKPDVCLPAESLGFPTGGLAGLGCSPHVPPLVYPFPGMCQCPRHRHAHLYPDIEGEERNHGSLRKTRTESRHSGSHEHSYDFDHFLPT